MGKQSGYLLFLFSAEVWLRDLPAWVFGFNLASSFVASSGEEVLGMEGVRNGGRELQSAVAAYVNYSADVGQMREMGAGCTARPGVNCRLMI